MERFGVSDCDNVHRRTDVDGMVNSSRRRGRFHVKPEENWLRPLSFIVFR
mgnify:CR=1 FL=1